MFYMHGAGWGWWMLGSIGMIAFWALIIFGIVWLVRGGTTPDREQDQAPEPPERILKRRLAQGEISIDEYERLREAIGDDAGADVRLENGRTTAAH